MATNQPPEQPRGLPRAGNFDTQTEYKAKVTIRKGAIGENPRGGVVQNYTIKVSEGFAVLKAKALSFRTATEFSGARLISEDIYLKKAKGAAQSQFVPLTEENFEANLRARWGLISAGDVARWQAQGKTAVEEFVFELFVYIHRRGSATGTGIRRATAARVQEAAQAITEYQRANQVTFGPIRRNHLEIHQARQPEGTPFELPNDNTTRQAEELDTELQNIQQRAADREAENRVTERTIRIKIQGNWLDLTVDVSSLRTALGLPQHNLFHQGIFHEFQHPEIEGADVEDTDHEPPPAATTG